MLSVNPQNISLLLRRFYGYIHIRWSKGIYHLHKILKKEDKRAEWTDCKPMHISGQAAKIQESVENEPHNRRFKVNCTNTTLSPKHRLWTQDFQSQFLEGGMEPPCSTENNNWEIHPTRLPAAAGPPSLTSTPTRAQPRCWGCCTPTRALPQALLPPRRHPGPGAPRGTPEARGAFLNAFLNIFLTLAVVGKAAPCVSARGDHECFLNRRGCGAGSFYLLDRVKQTKLNQLQRLSGLLVPVVLTTVRLSLHRKVFVMLIKRYLAIGVRNKNGFRAVFKPSSSFTSDCFVCGCENGRKFTWFLWFVAIISTFKRLVRHLTASMHFPGGVRGLWQSERSLLLLCSAAKRKLALWGLFSQCNMMKAWMIFFLFGTCNFNCMCYKWSLNSEFSNIKEYL